MIAADAALVAKDVLEAVVPAAHAVPFPEQNNGLLKAVLSVLGVLTTIVALFMANSFRNRKLTTQVNGELRKEFIEEMQRLRQEVSGLRTENSNLREEVKELHQIITGMRREGVQAAASAQATIIRNMPPDKVSDTLKSALDTLDSLPGVRP